MQRLRLAVACICLVVGLVWPYGLAAQPMAEAVAETPDSPPGDDRPEIASDSQLQTVLGRVFEQVGELDEIEVTVADGVVRLEGTVPTARARAQAESLAGGFAHTLYVDNQIQVVDAPDDKREMPTEQSVEDEVLRNRLDTIFSRVDELEQVQVTVDSGVVHLTGETASPEAVDQAEKLAGKLEGVWYVDNDIELLQEVGQRLSPTLQAARDRLVEFAKALPLFLVALVILAIFGVFAALVSRIPLPGKRFEEQPFLGNFARQALAVIVFAAGVLFVLELFEVTTLVGAVLGTAGVAGLAIGLAFRDIAENYLASIWLGVQQPFAKNELVDIGEYHGKVIRLTTRATVLMTLEGNHVRIPNATVFKEPISNYMSNPRRRFTLSMEVGPDEALSDVQNIGVEMLRQAEAVLDEPEPFATVEQLEDGKVTLHFYGWIDQRDYDWIRVKSEALRHLKGVLEAEGIEIPEPTLRVLTADLGTFHEHEDKRRERASRELDKPARELEPTPEIDEQIEEDREQSDEEDLLS